ncbi:hypothetical protein K525DRAFT_260940, partial [Schizophyllum commune Loenen D]
MPPRFYLSTTRLAALRSKAPCLLPPPALLRTMSIDAARDRVAAQLKVDLISPSYLEDNAAKLREIGRTFIC